MTHQDEQLPSTPSDDKGTSSSTPQARSSNLRSRWKRKNSPAQNTQAAAKPSCGEIDPETVRHTLKSSAQPSTQANEEAISPNKEREEGTELQKARPTHARPQREKGHMSHAEDLDKGTPRAPSSQQKSFRSASKNTATPRGEKAEPKINIKPATYNPTSLEKESIWERILNFFKDLFSDSNSKSAKKAKANTKQRSSYSREYKPSRNHPRAKKNTQRGPRRDNMKDSKQNRPR